MSGDIEDLGVFHKDYYWAGFSNRFPATFSIVNGRLFFSMGTDFYSVPSSGKPFLNLIRALVYRAGKALFVGAGVLNCHALFGHVIYL